VAEFSDFIEGMDHFHDDIAQDVFGNKDWQLKCSKCGRLLSLSTSEASTYLRIGWPMCCGKTMALIEVPNSHN